MEKRKEKQYVVLSVKKKDTVSQKVTYLFCDELDIDSMGL